MNKYETFNHTADLGVRVFGRTSEEVFANAAYALFDLMTDLSRVEEKLSFEVQLAAQDLEELLVRWLSELLFLRESRGGLFKKFSFSQLSPTALQAVARGEIFEPSRHDIKMEIKAVTYHQLEVKEKNGQWEARVIFDV